MHIHLYQLNALKIFLSDLTRIINHYIRLVSKGYARFRNYESLPYYVQIQYFHSYLCC